MLGDYEGGYEITRKINLDFIHVIDPEDLFYAMLEHLTSCLYTNRFPEVLSRIEELEQIKSKPFFSGNLAIDERFFYFKTNYSLISYISIGDTEKSELLIHRILQDVMSKKSALSEQMSLVLQSTLAESYFILGDARKSKVLLNNIRNQAKGKIRKDVIRTTRFLYLFLLLELNQVDLLESELNSSKNYFSKEKEVYNYELSVIAEIQRFIMGQITFEILAEKISNVTEDSMRSGLLSAVFDDIIYLIWSRSIINGHSTMSEFKLWYDSELSKNVKD